MQKYINIRFDIVQEIAVSRNILIVLNELVPYPAYLQAACPIYCLPPIQPPPSCLTLRHPLALAAPPPILPHLC